MAADYMVLDWGGEATIHLKPGMAWLLYVDDGPGGPCGQDSRTTCPHAQFHTFPDEDAMRAFVATEPFRNPRHRMFYGIVGEWTTPGVMAVIQH